MNSITLKRKNIVPLEINGKDYIVVLDNYTIDHFQRVNKIGLLKFYEDIKDMKKTGDVKTTQIIKLLGSLIREKKSGAIVGEKFLKQFDSFDVLQKLTPVLHKAFGENMPEAKEEDEKK